MLHKSPVFHMGAIRKHRRWRVPLLARRRSCPHLVFHCFARTTTTARLSSFSGNDGSTRGGEQPLLPGVDALHCDLASVPLQITFKLVIVDQTVEIGDTDVEQ